MTNLGIDLVALHCISEAFGLQDKKPAQTRSKVATLPKIFDVYLAHQKNMEAKEVGQ